MTSSFTEFAVEETTLAWLEAIRWQVAHGPDIAPDTQPLRAHDFAVVALLSGGRVVLLPKLISGNLRIGDAEKFIGKSG